MQGSYLTSSIPDARWSCPGRTAATCCSRWLTSRCSPRQPGSLWGPPRHINRSERSGWRAARTGNTGSCGNRREGDWCISSPPAGWATLSHVPWHPPHPHHRFDGQSSNVPRLRQQVSGSHLPVRWTQETVFVIVCYPSLKIPMKKAETVPTRAFANIHSGHRSDPEYRSTLISPALERLTVVQSALWWDGLPVGTDLVRGLAQLQEGLLQRLQEIRD